MAVAAVAYAHWLPAWQFGIPFGAGVHLFFVLSGFLITRILLDIRTMSDRRAAVGRFYLRRALRLFPAFYLVLGVTAWAGVPLVRETWPWHAAYLSNVYIAGQQRWLGHVSHFWSLAVEEQFYVVWPWIVVWARPRWLGPLVVFAALAGPATRLAAAASGLAEPFWALVPGGSADSLAIGAMIAGVTGLGDAEHARRSGAWVRRAALVGATVWCVWAAAEWQGPLPAPVAVWRQVAQGAVFGWIVWRAATGFSGWGGRVLAHPVSVYVGRISYGVYLIHAFAPVLLHATLRTCGLDALMPTGGFARAAAYWMTTLVAASVMWHLVEMPINALKRRVPIAA